MPLLSLEFSNLSQKGPLSTLSPGAFGNRGSQLGRELKVFGSTPCLGRVGTFARPVVLYLL